MANITLSIPDELKNIMSKFPEINWSGLVKISIENKVKHLKWKEQMLEQLESEKEFENWTVEMGRKVNKEITEKLKKRKLIN